MRLWSKFQKNSDKQTENQEEKKQIFDNINDFENDNKLNNTDYFDDSINQNNDSFSADNNITDENKNVDSENEFVPVNTDTEVNDSFGMEEEVRNITDSLNNSDSSIEEQSFSDVENSNNGDIGNEFTMNDSDSSKEKISIGNEAEKIDESVNDFESIISSDKNNSSGGSIGHINENTIGTEEVNENVIEEENNKSITFDINDNISDKDFYDDGVVQNETSNEERYDDSEIVISEDEIDTKSGENTTTDEFLNELEKKLDSSPENIEKLQNLKDKLEKYTDRKEKNDENGNESSSQLENNSNFQLLEQLAEIKPYFERKSGDGFSINLTGEKVSDSLIRTLVTKFLNQRFCSSSDLNIRSSSLERSDGFYRWDLVQIVKHLETEQVTKIPYDKYGYKYAEGKHENIPLSFYFDMSGSMASYSNLLAVISFELLKRNVKVLAGFNEKVRFQFDSVDKDVSIEDFADAIKDAGTYFYSNYHNRKIKKQIINENIDSYLIRKKAEKCVVFADFDPLYKIIELSKNADVYWFCFEEDIIKKDLAEFRGFLYQVEDEKDIVSGLTRVSEYRFQTLCNLSNGEYQKRK